ncbi:unnamed protein product [Sphagnum tenellum]
MRLVLIKLVFFSLITGGHILFYQFLQYQKKCCRGMDPMTFTRPVHSMRGTMTFVKLLNSALSSSLQHYECSAPTSSRQFCSLGNGIYKA